MALISKEQKDNKSELKIKIPTGIKEAVDAYCQWADIEDVSHFFAEAAKLVFAKDKDWQQVSKKS